MCPVSSTAVPLRCCIHTNSSEVPSVRSGLHVLAHAPLRMLLLLGSSIPFSKTHLECKLLGQASPKRLNHPKVPPCWSNIGNVVLLEVCYHKCKFEPYLINSSYHLLNCNCVPSTLHLSTRLIPASLKGMCKYLHLLDNDSET